MRQSQAKLDELDIAVVVVVFAGEDAARDYARDTGIEWPIVVDPERELYRHYGMNRASFWEVWSPKTLWTYARLLLSGRRPQPAGDQDTRQLGGDVLIDPGGEVCLRYVSDGPSDRPAVTTLVDEVRSRR